MGNGKERKNYGSGYKAKVAMEAVSGRLTINEIAKRHEVHPVQVSKWKKQFLEGAAGIFENGRNGRNAPNGNRREAGEAEELTNQLYQQIGQPIHLDRMADGAANEPRSDQHGWPRKMF
ncbi:MAG: transposase [Pyrinomonadaceae bacterium]